MFRVSSNTHSTEPVQTIKVTVILPNGEQGITQFNGSLSEAIHQCVRYGK